MSSRSGRASWSLALAPAVWLLVGTGGLRLDAPSGFPEFRAHEIATGLRGGYQVLVTDLNRDGRLDVVAVATGMSDLVWFENPTWERHVIATGLSGMINAAAVDLDEDGVPELALAHGFATNPARSVGNVSLLTHAVDPEQPWSVRELDRVPTAHRLRWYRPDGASEWWLLDAPLAGASARPPAYSGPTPVHAYRPPAWQREALPDLQEGVVHALEPVDWEDEGPSVLLAGFQGVTRYRWTGEAWAHARLVAGDTAPAPAGGSSEAALGALGEARFLATIEPWHGGQVVVYRESAGWMREVVDGTLTDGHTLLAVDLDGDGRDEIVAGERGGARSLRIYAASVDGSSWSRTLLDEGRMGAAGCAAADLNADGRVDIVCIATATANLVWYENLGQGGTPSGSGE